MLAKRRQNIAEGMQTENGMNSFYGLFLCFWSTGLPVVTDEQLEVPAAAAAAAAVADCAVGHCTVWWLDMRHPAVLATAAVPGLSQDTVNSGLVSCLPFDLGDLGSNDRASHQDLGMADLKEKISYTQQAGE